MRRGVCRLTLKGNGAVETPTLTQSCCLSLQVNKNVAVWQSCNHMTIKTQESVTLVVFCVRTIICSISMNMRSLEGGSEEWWTRAFQTQTFTTWVNILYTKKSYFYPLSSSGSQEASINWRATCTTGASSWGSTGTWVHTPAGATPAPRWTRSR